VSAFSSNLTAWKNVAMSRSERLLTDRNPDVPRRAASTGGAAPTIAAGAGSLIIGTGFLPDQDVTVRVAYIAEDISDYLTYATDHGGALYAELPTAPTRGPLQVTVTDHRTDPDGECGLLWSNVHTIPQRDL
jgi:hypothetical protein